MADKNVTSSFHSPSYKTIIINGKAYCGKFDYTPSPPTLIKNMTGITYSLNPGTLVLSGFENGQFRENQIKEGSTINLEDICLSVVCTINQFENEIVFMVTDAA